MKAIRVFGFEDCCKRMKDAILEGDVEMTEEGTLQIGGSGISHCPWCGKVIDVISVRRPCTRIGFYNRDGEEDETEFDTTDDSELAELWWDFCKETGIIAYTDKEE